MAAMLRRLIVPTVVSGIGIVLAIAAAWYVDRTETREIMDDFESKAANQAGLIQREIELHLEVLQSLVGLYAASGVVSSDEFRVFAIHALIRHPDIAALEWAPVVPHDERAAVEQAARRDGYLGFQFTERSASGEMVRAIERNEYVPVRYVWPVEDNEDAVGFDLASAPNRRAMLHEARDSSDMRASGRLELVQSEESQFGFLVVQPIYTGHPETIDARRESLRGFLVAAYRLEEVFERVLALAGGFDRHAEVSLFDKTAPEDVKLLCIGDSHEESNLLRSSAVEVEVGAIAGRRWAIRAVPTEAYFKARRSLQAPATLVVGTLFAVFLGSLIGVVSGRNKKVRELVEARTRELKRVTEETERQHDILQSVLESLADGVSVTDIDGRLKMFNPAAERILGRGLVQSGPREWTKLYGLFRPNGTTPIPSDELPLARAVNGEEPEEEEMFVRNPNLPDGRFIRVKATPLRDSSGRPRGGVAIFRDVTERKRAEAQLRDSEGRFRSIVEATASVLIILDREHRILEFNPRAEQIFGTQRLNAVGSNFLELCLPGEFHPIVIEDIRKTFVGETKPGLATPVRASDGTDRTLLWSFSLQSGLKDRPAAIIATGIDITERREAQEARRVRELAAHLQSARENERRHIAREIHDELGQALTGLKLEVSFIARKRNLEAETIRPKLVDLGRQIDRTIEFVRQLAAELRPQLLDELGLIDAIRFQVGEFEKRTGIHCSTELPQAAIDWSQEQSIAAYRIVQESLTNVARHSDAKNVLVRVGTGDDAIVIEIADDGRGITEPQAASGHSFGLLGMRERARMFGGSFRIESREGGGTTVTVRMRR
jgi:PAS domain S-box-containing protein